MHHCDCASSASVLEPLLRAFIVLESQRLVERIFITHVHTCLDMHTYRLKKSDKSDWHMSIRSGFMRFMWLALWEAVLESSYLGGRVGGEELCHVSEACGGTSALVPSVGADRGFDPH